MKEKKKSYVRFLKENEASKQGKGRCTTRDLNRRHPKSLTKERKFSKTPSPRFEPVHVTRFQEDAVNLQ